MELVVASLSAGRNRGDMSAEAVHRDDLPPCPFLPGVEEPLDHVCMKPFRIDRGPGFYEQALGYAASLWRQGSPARSLLLINRAFGADLHGDEAVLDCHPLPYAAVDWIIANRPDGLFIGNPRRHYQHLATRMVGPRKGLRTWRAWACWAIACRHLSPDEFPADNKQMAEEGIVEPGHRKIESRLRELGHPGEVETWLGVVGG